MCKGSWGRAVISKIFLLGSKFLVPVSLVDMGTFIKTDLVIKTALNLFTKQKQTYRYQKQTYGYQRGNVGGEGGMNQEIGMNTHTLYIRQITNEDLLCSTGISTQYSGITYMRKESKKE